MDNQNALKSMICIATVVLLMVACVPQVTAPADTQAPEAPATTQVSVAEVPADTSTPIPSTNTPVPVPPTNTSVLVLPTSTPAPPSETILYVCAGGTSLSDLLDLESFALTEECTLESGIQYGFQQESYPYDFEYPLEGDISGTAYTFNLRLGSHGTTNFDVALILSQAESETTLASTSFTSTSTEFGQFSDSVTGLDPTTADGDSLILRISYTGDPGALAIGGAGEMETFIKVPPIK